MKGSLKHHKGLRMYWVYQHWQSNIDIPPEDMDDESVEKILLNNHGKSEKNPQSLIKKDEFCAKSQQ